MQLKNDYKVLKSLFRLIKGDLKKIVNLNNELLQITKNAAFLYKHVHFNDFIQWENHYYIL